jgi:lysophospholipase L1-like esterase
MPQAGPQPVVAHEALVTQIIKDYGQLIARAHARGLRIVGATIMPYGGSDYHPTDFDETDRRTVNQWIRTRAQFDAVIDWDVVMRDPSDPTRLNPAYDWGDHIHPSPAGHRAMVGAIPIEELLK